MHHIQANLADKVKKSDIPVEIRRRVRIAPKLSATAVIYSQGLWGHDPSVHFGGKRSGTISHCDA